MKKRVDGVQVSMIVHMESSHGKGIEDKMGLEISSGFRRRVMSQRRCKI